MSSKTITQKRLKALIIYNPKTGLMTWKAPRGRVKVGAVISCQDSRGYVVVRLDGVLHRVHRLVWLFVHGKMPKLIDHVNRDPADNRISNLRECSVRDNALNKSMQSNNTTGYTGVSFDKVKKLYRATTSVYSKQVFLGYFKTPEEAYKVYLEQR